MTESHLERKERVCLTCSNHCPTRRELKVGTQEMWRQRSQKHAASCLLLVICSALLPMVCTVDNGLGPPSPVINQETLYVDSWRLYRSKPHWFLALRG